MQQRVGATCVVQPVVVEVHRRNVARPVRNGGYRAVWQRPADGAAAVDAAVDAAAPLGAREEVSLLAMVRKEQPTTAPSSRKRWRVDPSHLQTETVGGSVQEPTSHSCTAYHPRLSSVPVRGDEWTRARLYKSGCGTGGCWVLDKP